MASSSLYEFLTRVLNIEGAVVGEDIGNATVRGTASGRTSVDPNADDKKVHRSSKEKGRERESKEANTMQGMCGNNSDLPPYWN